MSAELFSGVRRNGAGRRRAPRHVLGLVPPLLVLIALLAGCATTPEKPPASSAPVRGAITELNLLAVPVAMNFDQLPGPDGFVLTIYAGNKQLPKPLIIEKGTLEILMFDGLISPASESAPRPRQTWKYSAENLVQYTYKTSIGTGYRVTPVWGQNRPQSAKITVVARYSSEDGKMIYSAPSIISITATESKPSQK